jgi:hypothetical protein
MKKNENDGSSPSGFATLADTPGMGNVVMPTATSVGSGDVFGNVLDFSTWKRSKRKRKKRSRRR